MQGTKSEVVVVVLVTDVDVEVVLVEVEVDVVSVVQYGAMICGVSIAWPCNISHGVVVTVVL